MKVRLQESGALGILRCPTDNKTLLTFNNDDVILEDCEHYHWHLGPDEGEINKKDERGDEEDGEEETEEEDEEGEELDEQDWFEILRQNYIAAVSVEGTKFYLIPVKKAMEKG